MKFPSFQFLTQIDGACFPVTGPSDRHVRTQPNSAGQVTGTFSLIVSRRQHPYPYQHYGEWNHQQTNNTMTNGVVMGTWTITGSEAAPERELYHDPDGYQL